MRGEQRKLGWARVVALFFLWPYAAVIVMDRFSSGLIAAGIAIAVASVASAAPAAVKITRVVDKRVYVAPNTPPPVFPGNPAGLTIVIHVGGRAGDAASYYGGLSVGEIEANRGNALRLRSSDVGGLAIDRGNKAMHKILRGNLGGPATKGFDVRLHFTEPRRKATRIKEIKGSFRVITGGRLHTVAVNPLASMGQSIHSPALTKAALRIKILKAMPMGSFMPGSANQSLILAVGGHKTALEKVRILSASGGNIFAGFTSSSDRGGTTISSYQLKRPLKAGDKVELIVATGQKTLTVPFDFRNIKLP